MRLLRRVASILLALVPLLVACDSGPSGPGSFEATLVPPAQVSLGGALVSISGDGVRGISADGSTRVFSSGPTQDGAYRVLLMNTVSGMELRFRVEVRDVGAPPPAATILELVSTENQPVPSVRGARIRFDP